VGISLDDLVGVDKTKVLRNMCSPEIGLHVLNSVMGRVVTSQDVLELSL
jgi:hypothetical protein